MSKWIPQDQPSAHITMITSRPNNQLMALESKPKKQTDVGGGVNTWKKGNTLDKFPQFLSCNLVSRRAAKTLMENSQSCWLKELKDRVQSHIVTGK